MNQKPCSAPFMHKNRSWRSRSRRRRESRLIKSGFSPARLSSNALQNMKKPLWRLYFLLGATPVCGLLLVGFSYSRAISVDNVVLKPCLDAGRHYERTIRLQALDPWTSILPQWTIGYSERPRDIRYDSPSVSISLFGRVLECRLKEVAMTLVTKGYRKSY